MIEKQTRKASFVEALINAAIGYAVAVLSQIIVFPWFGIYVPLETNFSMGIIFTFVSIARSFLLRRMFEILRVKKILP